MKTHAIVLVASRSIYGKGSKLTYLYVRLELGMAQMVVGFLSSPGVMCEQVQSCDGTLQ